MITADTQPITHLSQDCNHEGMKTATRNTEFQYNVNILQGQKIKKSLHI